MPDRGGHTRAADHDPYEGLDKDEKDFLEDFKRFLTKNYPKGVPFKLEVTNGVARERLTLGDGDEVFMLKKRNRPHASERKRKIDIDIMSETDAKNEIKGLGAIDPCCWWEWDGNRWVCVAYGD